MTTDETFADLLTANATYAESAAIGVLEAPAARGLAVITCMDARIDPLRMLGLELGDAIVVRNAGARVTDDVLDTLVISSYLLKVERVMVVAHTKCKVAGATQADIHNAIGKAGGPDTRSIGFLTTTDQEQALRDDVQRIRSWPYLGSVTAGGFVYDVQSGQLSPVC